MSPLEREAIEAKAERALRRGELSEAFGLYKQLTAAFPSDQSLARRVVELQENLQPAELMNPKSNFRSESTAGAPSSPVDAAEVCASKGDYRGAISIYRTLLAERPDSELLRERMAELFELAQAGQAPPKQVAQTKPLDAVLADLLSRISDRKR